eukprot:2373218-Amphidinium_carterae.1
MDPRVCLSISCCQMVPFLFCWSWLDRDGLHSFRCVSQAVVVLATQKPVVGHETHANLPPTTGNDQITGCAVCQQHSQQDCIKMVEDSN